MQLPKKTAVITGASRGLGRAIARRFASENVQVCLIARDKNELSSLKSELEGQGFSASVYAWDLNQVDQLGSLHQCITEQYSTVDYLINNAGLGYYKPLTEHSVEEVLSIYTVNLIAPTLLCRLFSQTMIAQGKGHIINIGSDLSRKPLANMAPYVASKHGLMGMSQSLLREVKDLGVRVSMVNSGVINTAFDQEEEGSKDAKISLQPSELADLVWNIATQPGFQLIDEVMVHPLHQAF